MDRKDVYYFIHHCETDTDFISLQLGSTDNISVIVITFVDGSIRHYGQPYCVLLYSVVGGPLSVSGAHIICMCKSTHVCMYVNKYICVFKYIYIHVHTHIYIQMYTYLYILYVCIFICTYLHIYICVTLLSD